MGRWYLGAPQMETSFGYVTTSVEEEGREGGRDENKNTKGSFVYETS